MLPPLATWLALDALMLALTGVAPLGDVAPVSQVIGVMLGAAGVYTLPVARKTATGLRRLVARAVAAGTLGLGALHVTAGLVAMAVPWRAAHVTATALALLASLYAWRSSPALRR